MNRRFLYMLVASKLGSCTLRRINPSRLFYPKDSLERAVAAVATMKTAAAARVVEDARLPPPTATFRSHCGIGGLPYVALLGRDKDKILVVDPDEHDTFGHTVLYDDGSRAFHVLPSPRCTRINPFGAAVGDGVYFMEDVRQPDGSGGSVDALVPLCDEDGDY